jgi:hypothetical protein
MMNCQASTWKYFVLLPRDRAMNAFVAIEPSPKRRRRNANTKPYPFRRHHRRKNFRVATVEIQISVVNFGKASTIEENYLVEVLSILA